MRVVLRITSEQDEGRRAWLRAGQSMVVGRTNGADFVLAHDQAMSASHFALRCTESTCHIRDLKSTNGTIVNGEAITETVLRDQDRIVAGKTTFVTTIEDEAGCQHHHTLPTAHFSPPNPRASAKRRVVMRRWTFGELPANWEPVEGKGLRRNDPARFPSSVVVSEQRIPERWSLKDYVIHVQSQLARVLAEVELSEPHSMELVGADEAIQLTIRQPPSGGIALVQQQIYVRAQQTVGCAVFITTSDEFEDLAAEFTSIRQSMEFRAEVGPPIRCHGLAEPGIHADSPPTTERLERCP